MEETVASNFTCTDPLSFLSEASGCPQSWVFFAKMTAFGKLQEILTSNIALFKVIFNGNFTANQNKRTKEDD